LLTEKQKKETVPGPSGAQDNDMEIDDLRFSNSGTDEASNQENEADIDDDGYTKQGGKHRAQTTPHDSHQVRSQATSDYPIKQYTPFCGNVSI